MVAPDTEYLPESNDKRDESLGPMEKTVIAALKEIRLNQPSRGIKEAIMARISETRQSTPRKNDSD